jgi:hypothetical protein
MLVLACAATGVRAEDDDLSLDQRIMRNFLGTFGLGGGTPEIEYRERSPLVVPPKADLPPPLADPTGQVANWPNDPTVKRRKEEAERRRSGKAVYDETEDARPLRPDELEMGRVSRRGVAREATDDEKEGRPLKPSELGYRGGVFGTLFGQGKEEEAAQFTREPPRSSLTEPPAGYQTPSPNQPYRAKSERWVPTIPSFFDKGTSE